MGLFKKKSRTKAVHVEDYRGQRADRKAFVDAAKPGAFERISRAGEAYPDRLTAGMSGAEQTGMEGLEKHLASALPTESDTYASAKDEIMKTLEGDYDPSNGEYYKALKTSILRELAESKDRLASRTSASDSFFGGGRIATEGELEEDSMGQIGIALAQLFERERDKKYNAASDALGLVNFEEQAPLQRIAASQQYGDLPRLIEQASLDAEYNEWMRQLNDLGIPLDVAMQMATYQPNFYTKTTGGGNKNWVNDTMGVMGILSGLGAL